MTFAESTLWRERFTESRAWQAILSVACVWLAFMECACAWGQTGLHAFNPGGATPLGSGAWLRMLHPNHCSSHAIHWPTCGQLNVAAAAPTWACLCRSAEPPADDSDQADDSQSGGDGLVLTGVELSPRAAEWRLIRPDTQLSNSFIHSKSEPPPLNQPPFKP